MIDAPSPPARPTGLGVRSRITPRTVQIILGVMWIIDAGLQFQPKMFTDQFVQQVLLPAAQGQPGWLATPVVRLADVVSHHEVVWDLLFGLTQLAIGIGLLFKRTVKPALVVSFAWALSVWIFGEGMGQMLTGDANALMGAPGAVLLYAVVGVLVWPTTGQERTDSPTGLASSAGSGSLLGRRGGIVVWTVLWAGLAVLFLLPNNRRTNSLHAMFTSMSSGQPSWYAHFLGSIAHGSVGAGTWVAVFLAVICLVIAVGPLVSRHPSPFLVGGALLGVLFWLTGQALGGLLTGLGTDPGSGPLLVLLALTLLPAGPARSESPAPLNHLFDRRPGWAVLAVTGLIVVPVTAASVPVVATAASRSVPATTSGATSTPGPAGMAGMDMSGGSAGTDSPSKTTPMAGMAGTGATDPTWQYRGPALPESEVALLSASSATQDQGHSMQTPHCTAAPTPNQILGATQYVQAVTSAVSKYKVLSVATAAGYRPVTPPGYPVVHYVNPAYRAERFVMDPNHVDSLVYAFTPDGPVLVAAMFLLHSRHADGPMPYGCLVQWHAHTNLCTSTATHTVVGFTPCGVGQVNTRTAYMTHVWQVQVPGGPLSIDPSDLQVMEAAINAQQSGLAPVTSPGGVVSYNQATAPVGAF